jgi:ribosomal protein S18 acetylase RimI-like enzyme
MLHDPPSFMAASEDDLPVFERLARDAMATFYDAHGIEWNSELFGTGFRSTENYRIDRAGATVGMVRIAHEADHIYVFDLHVEPSARNQGIGTHALNFICSIAVQADKKSIRMRVFRSNRAIKLYERVGFMIVGEDNQLLRLEHVLSNASATAA